MNLRLIFRVSFFSVFFSLGLSTLCFAVNIPLHSLDNWAAMVTPKTQVTTNYRVHDQIIHIESRGSHSGLTWKETINVHETNHLSFSWKVSGVIPSADITKKASDDAPIRVLILFTEDDDRKSWFRRQLDKVFLMVYGKLPYDYSLAYVWANRPHEGDYIEGAYSHKLRTVPLDMGSRYVGQWRDHTVNIYDDFKRIYGAEPPKTATLGLLSDTDNTTGRIVAGIRAIQLY